MKFSLKFKILFFTIALIILISFSIGIITIDKVSKNIENQIKYRLSALASNLALNAEDPIVLEEDTYLAGLVKDAMTNNFLYAKILDKDYNVLASDKMEEWGEVDSTILYSKGNEFIVEKNKIEIIKPVYLGNQKIIGYIKLAMSKDEITKARKEIIYLIGIITISFILLGIIFAFIFSTFLTKQLNLLMDGVKKVAKGDFNVKVKKVSNDELGLFTDTFNQMVENIREKELIKMAFSRYVSKQVAEKVFENPDAFLDKLKGERRNVAVLFADIMGFTSMSEKMPPEDVVQILNTYLTSMTESVFKYEGTLDKFIGDCIMAVFGAPIELENPSLNAVKCAIDMQKNVDEINRIRREKGLLNVNVGIGVNMGIAVVGNIGSKQRLDYTVIGDTVNLAARLQSAANSMKISVIVSRSVVNNLSGQVGYEKVDTIKVKGKEEPVEIYKIV